MVFLTVSDEERREFVGATVEHVAGRIPVRRRCPPGHITPMTRNNKKPAKKVAVIQAVSFSS